MRSLQVIAIPTRIFHQGDKILDFLLQHVPVLQEGNILAVTSKIISLGEGAVVSKSSVSKKELIKKEADVYLGELAYDCHLTIKHGLLIPSSGIDESNSENEEYILFPQDPFLSARTLCDSLKSAYKLNKLGLIITDSHTSPLRRGVTGVCLAYAGMEAVTNFIGQPDIFGRQLKMTQINNIDALSAAAVWCMGESNECTPIALIKTESVKFVDSINRQELSIGLEEDLYSPLLKAAIKGEPLP
ncbi:MAG TPA: coenzyme F420-0:L-glutamate ligase [Pseudobdellovibrionaceae bacterium]|jgi:putative folate metabolism gamma-glutamate ligase